MFTSIDLISFQKHRKRQFDLAPVTVFCGPTGKGKSSILRAFEWLAQNRPGGDAFVSWDDDHSKVKLAVDGYRVTRKKGKGVNSYHLDEEEYVAFGSDVPDTIAELLNVDERNFQNQHDAPFWLSLTSGQVAKELNEIIDLGVIDSTLANIAKQLRLARSTKEVVEVRLKEARDARAKLSWVVDAKLVYDELVRKDNGLSENRTRIDALETIIANVKVCVTRQQVTAETILYGLKVCATGQKIVDLGERIKRLQDLVDWSRNLKASTEMAPSLASIATSMQSILVKAKKVTKLEDLIVEMKESSNDVSRLKGELLIAQNELAEVMEGQCPVCGKEIGPD